MKNIKGTVREKQSQVLSRLFFPHWEKLYASFHKKKNYCAIFKKPII